MTGGFEGGVAADGALMLVGGYDDWARLLAAIGSGHCVQVAVQPLPDTAAAQPLRSVVLVSSNRVGSADPAGHRSTGAVVDGGLCAIFAFDGFAALRRWLEDIIEWNDAAELESRGWHAHFDLDLDEELPTGLRGVRVSEIMLCGPNWR